jgi:hypothetical protein
VRADLVEEMEGVALLLADYKGIQSTILEAATALRALRDAREDARKLLVSHAAAAMVNGNMVSPYDVFVWVESAHPGLWHEAADAAKLALVPLDTTAGVDRVR